RRRRLAGRVPARLGRPALPRRRAQPLRRVVARDPHRAAAGRLARRRQRGLARRAGRSARRAAAGRARLGDGAGAARQGSAGLGRGALATRVARVTLKSPRPRRIGLGSVVGDRVRVRAAGRTARSSDGCRRRERGGRTGLLSGRSCHPSPLTATLLAHATACARVVPACRASACGRVPSTPTPRTKDTSVMTPLTDAQIRASFVNATRREIAQATLPDLSAVRWDRLEYLGWRDRKPRLAADVVVESADVPTGIVLRVAAGGSGPRRRAMCAWCEDVVETDDVTLLTARRAGPAGRRGDSIG